MLDLNRDRVLYSAGADGNIHAWDMVSVLYFNLYPYCMA